MTATQERPEREAALLTHALLVQPPVDLDAVANHLGYRVGESRSTGQESSFTHREARIVATNTKHAAPRRRFALAHALGHVVLHKHQLVVCKALRVDEAEGIATVATLPEEAEAHEFALALLLPSAWVRELVAALMERTPPREQLLRDVAHSFDVSTQAVTARLYGLGVLTS